MSVVGDVARKLVFRSLSSLEGGEIVLRYPDGRGRRFGDGNGPSVVVDLIRPAAVWERLGRRTRVGFGEGYVDGDWDTDDLVGLFALVGRNLPRLDDHRHIRRLYRAQALRPDRAQRQTPRAARSSIHAHYDLGNDLFEVMLDPTMTYSCAYWERPGMSLEEAQVAKVDRICRKLDLGPTDTVLEIGCGWGSFAIHAARTYGSRVVGVTISEAQAELARERVADAGLSHRIDIRLEDYRDTVGRFEKVVSIEMLEAIGRAEYDGYFATIDRLLAPNGLALVQTIGMPDARFERYRRRPDWIQQYVFPGSLLPSIDVLARSVARTRLIVHGLEEIGIGYARTLRMWRENVGQNVERVRALGYDERFLRIWTFYLAYCEAAFTIRALRDVQLVLTRPYNDALGEFPRPGFTY